MGQVVPSEERPQQGVFCIIEGEDIVKKKMKVSNTWRWLGCNVIEGGSGWLFWCRQERYHVSDGGSDGRDGARATFLWIESLMSKDPREFGSLGNSHKGDVGLTKGSRDSLKREMLPQGRKKSG